MPARAEAHAASPDSDRFIPETFQGRIEPNYFCRGWNHRRKKYCGARAGHHTIHVGEGRCYKHGGNARVQSGRYSQMKHVRLKQLVEQYSADPDPLNLLAEVAMGRALFTDFVERYDEMTTALIAWHDSWRLARRPLDEELVISLGNVVDEHENALVTAQGELTPGQVNDIEQARKLLKFVKGDPLDGVKPPHVLDITDAHRLLESVGKMVERIERIRAQNAITRPEMNRIFHEMWRAVDARVASEDVKAKIREDWLSVRL